MRVGKFINEVCEMFDIYPLFDVEAVSDDENDLRVTGVVALGWRGEPDAGIRYGVVTPWFKNEDLLDEFCEKNIDRFRTACDTEGAGMVDATEWR